MPRKAIHIVKPRDIDRVKLVAADAAPVEYRIEGVPGLTLKVGSMSAAYYVVYRVRGQPKQRRIRLGTRGIDRYDVVAGRALEIMGAAKRGDDEYVLRHERVEETLRKQQRLTFAELWEHRKADNLELTEGTLVNYQSVLSKYAMRTLGEKKADDITQHDVAAVLDAIRDTKGKLRRNPYNATLGAISSTFTYARGKGKTSGNPTEHLRPLPASKPRKRSLSDVEVGRLWNAIGAAPLSPKMRLCLRILFLTGQRNTNISGARVDWIRPNLDVANPLLVVPAERMKVKTDEHMLPLVPVVASLFKEAIALSPGSDFVFASPKRGRLGHYTRQAVSIAMQEVCAVAEIADVHAHDFRHLSRTFLAERQVPKDVRDKITHHSVSRVEHTYNSAKLHDPVRQALKMWADHVEGLARAASQLSKFTSIAGARSTRAMVAEESLG
jgi:integrase